MSLFSSLSFSPSLFQLFATKVTRTSTTIQLCTQCNRYRTAGLYNNGVALFHMSSTLRGLEEFFPKTENIIEESEKTGRPWQARELRNKSNSDLHKLWYVLLKERNMLLTMKHEAKRQGFIMPAPERINKVKFSMAKIKLVISEREKAIEKAKRILREEQLKQNGNSNRQQDKEEMEGTG